jgi:hypothetical protein
MVFLHSYLTCASSFYEFLGAADTIEELVQNFNSLPKERMVRRCLPYFPDAY